MLALLGFLWVLWCPAALAAGPKSNGTLVVVDDALGGEAGSGLISGGPAEVAGGLATPAPGRVASIRDSYVDGGFYAFPFPFSRLLLIAPGEVPASGSFPGKTGQAAAHVRSSTFSVTVYATDWFYQPVADVVPQTVRFSTWGALAPSTQTLVQGATTFSNFFVDAATGTYVFFADDLTSPSVGVSASTIPISAPATSSPSVHLDIAEGGVYATLGGGISGTASDPSGVQRIQVAVRRIDTSLYYDPAAHGFNLAPLSYSDAQLGFRAAPVTTWYFSIPDADLADGVSYEVRLIAENPSALRVPSISTFTFDARGIAYSPDDGRASAFAAPVSTLGCVALIATVTVTVGGAGILPGGALALKLPAGWTLPAGLSASPAGPGEVAVVSTATAFTLAGSTSVSLNPSAAGAVPLGDGWILLRVPAGAPGWIRPGEDVVFTVRARPPIGPAGRGAQRFEVRTQAYSTGTLTAIAAQPAVDLTTGAAVGLAFRDASLVSLGPLQTSPTMQIETLDLCGNPAAPLAALTVTLQAGGIDAAGGFVLDPSAAFFAEQTGAAIAERIINPPNNRPFAPGGFYFRTAAAGPAGRYVRLTGSTIIPDSYRYVDLRPSSVAISGVSIDTGTLSPGTTSVSLATGAAATVRFTVADPEVAWEVLVATTAGFESPLWRVTGLGSPSSRSAVWPALDARSDPPRSVGPGLYRVLIRAGGGAAEDRRLEARVPATPFVFGNLGVSGAGALVRAVGPGLPGSFAVASSTGYFEVYGLLAGAAYQIVATTRTLALGQPVELSTAASGVLAAPSGGDAGPLAFTGAAVFRVSVSLPAPAPAEFVGRVSVHAGDFSLETEGGLHFSSGAARSDSGGHLFGGPASTWTVLALPPGTYDVDVSIPQVGLSTTVARRSVAAGQVEDLQLFFARKPSLYGWAVLPSTRGWGAWISVQATKAGERSPSVWGGGFALGNPAPRSSAPYALFGLDPGSWTVLARSQGFVSTSAVVVVSTSDIGDPSTFAGGLDLRLGSGGVLVATVTVLGDTRSLPGACTAVAAGGCPASGFVLYLQAYNLATFSAVSAPVSLATSAVVSVATVALSGLESGPQLVRAYLTGFQLDPPGGSVVLLSTPAAAAVSLGLRPDDARLRLDVRVPPLPGGACYSTGTFGTIGFLLDRSPAAAPLAGADITALAPVASGPAQRSDPASGLTETFYCSSMSFLSSVLGPGPRRVWALSGSSGAASFQTLPLVGGATTVFTADLTGPVFTVTGTVALSGSLSFTRPDGTAVTVSSAAGLLALAPATPYCLLSSSAPVSLSAARVELVPLDAGGEAPGALLTASAAGDCRAFAVPGARLANGLADPGFRLPALVAYVGRLRADGGFSISSVPAGSYLLRNVPDLDGDPSNGEEAAGWSAIVRISSSGSLGTVGLSAGAAVSGSVLGPAGADRPMRVTLTDGSAQAVRAVELQAGAGAAAFSFPRVSAGRYVLQAWDLGFPRVYAAAPRAVDVPAGGVGGQDLRLVRGGAIRARVAVETLRADGSRESVLVSPSNPELLPAGMQVDAVANPWTPGGFFAALGRNCGAGGACRDVALDSDGRVAIDDVLPGVYDVEFLAPTAPEAAGGGGLPLASQVRSGVRVDEGQTVDLGVVRLPAAAMLAGRVVDGATGSPVGNARIRAVGTVRRPGDWSRRRPFVEALTGVDGRYALAGLDPTVRYFDIVAAARDIEPQGTPVAPYEQQVLPAVDLRSTATLDFSLMPASFSVSGRVAAFDGSPLFTAYGNGAAPGASVYLQKAGFVPVRDPIGDIQALTDGQGRFTIPAVTRGSYRLTVAALGLANLERTVDVAGTADLGTLTLGGGATLSGAVTLPDGSAPGDDDLEDVVGVTPDLAEYLPGVLERDRSLRAVTGYRVSGFKAGRSYRVLFVTGRGERVAPAEAADLVFESTGQARVLDLVLRREPPRVLAVARRQGAAFRIDFMLSQPLRSRTAADDDLGALVGTVSAGGALSEREISADRGRVSVTYTPGQASPGVAESSFTLRFSGRSSVRDPASADPVTPEFLAVASVTFHVGVDGLRRMAVNNFQGAVLALEGDASRVSLPKGAFAVDASSTVDLTLMRSAERIAPSARRSAAENLASLRFAPQAYPPALLGALAATPPRVTPFGPFYDIGMPAGMRSALVKPVELCVTYAAGADPSALNLYWYNAAANAYVLQQDVLGAEPTIDARSRVKCVHVNHFSTFVLFDRGVSVISGSGYGGGGLEAAAFPNPFDLSVKQVTPIHGLPAQTVRGTMVRIAVPVAMSGPAGLDVFDVAGRRVRSIDLGALPGGGYYYQAFDGRSDAGNDLASGVYVGQVRVAGRSAFFKMAVIK